MVGARGMLGARLGHAWGKVGAWLGQGWDTVELMTYNCLGQAWGKLRMALNVDWKQHKTNKKVYGTLPRPTMKI